MSVPDNWLAVCEAEVMRGKLTSHPLKLDFAKKNGMSGLDEVHDWMSKTRMEFIEMVDSASNNLTQP